MRRKPGARPIKNHIRIIGGKWRGRKLEFPEVDGLRPTGDRIRETLFNWLGQNLEGLRVLDLFAGSGALGLEALSRGAASVEFVEVSSNACDYLRKSLDLLETSRGNIHNKTAEDFLKTASPQPVDILFLDPPFAEDLHSSIIKLIPEYNILAPDALIYIESPPNTEINLPIQWAELKNKRAGDVRYRLVQLDCGSSMN